MKEEDLPIGKSAIIRAGEEEVALFNYKGRLYAIANKCLHKGAPLGEGRIEEGVIICPQHEWRYNLETGYCMQNPEMKTRVFPVKVQNRHIYVGGLFKDDSNKALGKAPSKIPDSIKFKIDTIRKPINPEETL
ncbi:MAG: ferredoxin [Nitrospinae bacterium CG11_big_fil_rev_8_21_14_0_20_56_8]|nr:MAG: ferredoxin [Nitrospinae bacterium CG11_big_fil_rev_8_21_14_0_20_56_8]